MLREISHITYIPFLGSIFFVISEFPKIQKPRKKGAFEKTVLSIEAYQPKTASASNVPGHKSAPITTKHKLQAKSNKLLNKVEMTGTFIHK